MQRQLYFHNDGTVSYIETQYKLGKLKGKMLTYKVEVISVQYLSDFMHMEMQFKHHLN